MGLIRARSVINELIKYAALKVKMVSDKIITAKLSNFGTNSDFGHITFLKFLNHMTLPVANKSFLADYELIWGFFKLF